MSNGIFLYRQCNVFNVICYDLLVRRKHAKSLICIVGYFVVLKWNLHQFLEYVKLVNSLLGYIIGMIFKFSSWILLPWPDSIVGVFDNVICNTLF